MKDKPTKEKVQPPNMPIAVVLEVSIIGSIPASKLLDLKGLVEDTQETLLVRFGEAGGKNGYPRWAEARPASMQELLQFVPRKVHFTNDGEDWICDTDRVARRNLTTSKDAVTCRLCRRRLGLSEKPEP